MLDEKSAARRMAAQAAWLEFLEHSLWALDSWMLSPLELCLRLG
jgi:hypothetical protein